MNLHTDIGITSVSTDNCLKKKKNLAENIFNF